MQRFDSAADGERNAYFKKLAEAAETTFWGHLGCELVEITDSRVVIKLDVQQQHLNLLGIVHGGVHAALLDNAMGLLAMSARPKQKLVTTNLNIQYLAAVGVGTIEVTAEMVHQSGKTITSRGAVAALDGKLLAVGTGSFRII